MKWLPYIWWSVDPGVKYLAWAVWRGSVLDGTGMSPLTWYPADSELIVLEKPQVYKDHRARTADLVDLAISAGQIAARFREVAWYLPREWKGQVPKKIHHPRILAQLTDHEKKCLPSKKGELKHVLDAVGLGLYHLKVKGVKRGT